jgi:hypothetical protein
MPQAALPDVNTILITYRRERIVDLKSKRFTGALGSLLSMNAALPKKYQVEISTKKYNLALNKNILAVCSKCKDEPEYHSLIVDDYLLSSFGSLVSGTKYEKRWKCSKCNYVNILSKTELIKPEPKKPFFLGVVPDPPILTKGLMSEIDYPSLFEAWAWNFSVELEYQMGKYRVEYKPQEGEEPEEILEGGEEEKIETLDGF